MILSTDKSYANSALVRIRQDDYGQVISAVVVDDRSSPIDLTKYKISLKVKVSQNVNSYVASGTSDGTATYTINKNEKLVSGAAWFELDDGDKRLSTQTFWLKVMEASEQVVEMADPLGGVTTIE